MLDDPAAPYIDFGAMTRAGDKLAAAEGTPPAATRIRFYRVEGDAVTYRCELTGARYDALSWAPDGSALAYEASGGIYIVPVGDLSSGCTGTPVRIASGQAPSWGPAPVPAELAARPVAGQRLRGALARGLRVSVDVPLGGRVTARAVVDGRRVATASATPRRSGTLTLRLRFTRAARERLRGRRAVPLRVTVAAAGSTTTTRVTLR